MKKFEDLNPTELWEIRQKVVVGSIYVSDYAVEGYHTNDICEFFDGYAEFLVGLSEEYGLDWGEYDNAENLYRWFCCFDDLSWVRLDDREKQY